MPRLPSGTITFLTTDIEGSTRLLQRLGDSYGQLLEQHYELVRRITRELGGQEVECSGDGFLLVFDRADYAVSAAVGIQRALASQPPTEAGPVRVRMGLHTGQPDLNPSGYVGLDLHRAARLGAAGHGGQTLLSRSTRQLVEHDLPDGVSLRDLGEHRLKDLPRPEEVCQLVIEGLPSDFPPLRSLSSRPNNLPGQLTNFIGRQQELADARLALARTRLLSLTGPGGTGKTRFALELANAVLNGFDDGACFVDLAPVFQPDLVISTVAQVLGVPDIQGRPPLEHLKDFLHDKHLLLVLDNFEQVLDAAPQLAELLAACSKVTAIATSRVALRVSGEHELQVPPLRLPDPAGAPQTGQDLGEFTDRFEAVRLFVERAQAVQADFRLTDETAPAVAEICRRLDGLPLAIELAAARVRLLPPRAMLARLTSTPRVADGVSEAPDSGGQTTRVSPLQFLTGGARDLPSRHQTLRATISWSYDLLEPEEQALFRRLAVFVGGFTLEAAAAAASTAAAGDRRWALFPEETLDGVESLIVKNLMRSALPDGSEPDEPRFTMLETIREFGLQQLAEAGELRSMRAWHSQYFLELAERAEPLLRGPDQRSWLDRLEAEHDNLRAALEWSLGDGRDGEKALRLCGALTWLWQSRAYATEGRRWMDRALAGPTRGQARLKTLNGAGWLAHLQRDASAARAHLAEAIALGKEMDDPWSLAWSHHLLGRVAYYENDAETARALGEQSLAFAERANDPYVTAWALHLLGLAAQVAADYPTAWEYYERSTAIRRQLGYREGIGICLSLMSMVAYRSGDYGESLTLVRESLRELRWVGAYWTANNTLAVFAALAAMLGQPRAAVRLAGATNAFGQKTLVKTIPLTQTMLDETLEIARRTMDQADYDATWAAGQALALDDAVKEALALELDVPDQRAESSDGGAPGGLSARELEVIRLIAEGRTSKEIAEALVVSIPTVERHITHIYTKIGARGRAEATAFALRHNLTS